ncbi:barstar family protein [Nonomuraea angiospora]|uniref:barstar family protein n=1 Tax=Nonomuraea angiospora TaxID=46172 RepID=UPI0029ABCFF8|nr:barstar family protein [Nonomuraea angiospora]MDX3099832.1 barstar family protein [Nonomuraea angiospora]
MDPVEPKFLLIDEDDQVLGVCLDAEGIFVEPTESDEELTVEILGCLPARRLRDYLEGSKRYRQRNPLDSLWLRMLDVAGEPLVDFWAGEIIDWRPSPLDPERVDIVAPWGFDSPSAGVRDVWERWRSARPDQPNQWAVYGSEGRQAWLTIVGRSRFRRGGGLDRLPGCVYHLDGTHVIDEAAFYLAIGEAINGPGGYFGWNLDALDDCLRGRFGARAPFTLIWSDSQVARESLTRTLEEADDAPSLFDVIQTIFAKHDVDVVLR